MSPGSNLQSKYVVCSVQVYRLKSWLCVLTINTIYPGRLSKKNYNNGRLSNCRF